MTEEQLKLFQKKVRRMRKVKAINAEIRKLEAKKTRIMSRPLNPIG